MGLGDWLKKLADYVFEEEKKEPEIPKPTKTYKFGEVRATAKVLERMDEFQRRWKKRFKPIKRIYFEEGMIYVEEEGSEKKYRITPEGEIFRVWSGFYGRLKEKARDRQEFLTEFLSTVDVEKAEVNNPKIKRGFVEFWFKVSDKPVRDKRTDETVLQTTMIERERAEVYDQEGNSLGEYEYEAKTYNDVENYGISPDEMVKDVLRSVKTGIFFKPYTERLSEKEVEDIAKENADLVAYKREGKVIMGGVEFNYERGYFYKGENYRMEYEEVGSSAFAPKIKKKRLPDTRVITDWLEAKGFDPLSARFVLDFKVAGYAVPEEFKDLERQIGEVIEKNEFVREWAEENFKLPAVSRTAKKPRLKGMELP